jgi:hypothetical protein
VQATLELAFYRACAGDLQLGDLRGAPFFFRAT